MIEEFNKWWEEIDLPIGGVNYNLAKAAWRRCETLANERIDALVKVGQREALQRDPTIYSKDTKLFDEITMLDVEVAVAKMTSTKGMFDG